MIRFIEERRAEVEKLAIISNMAGDTLTYMNSHFEWLRNFDEQIYSCEIGINKPDIRIYEACLSSLDIAAQECLFVDDSEENVLGAMKSGMHVIHFKTFAQFSQEMDRNFYLINDLQ